MPFLLIGPEWLPRFSLMPCLFSMRNTELRLLKPLALHTSSMGWPATYRLMTVFSLSSFCIFADETGGSDTIIFSCKLTTCSADLRRARTSSGKAPIISNTSDGLVSGNSSFLESIWSWMLIFSTYYFSCKSHYSFQCLDSIYFLHLSQNTFVLRKGLPPLAFCIIHFISGQCRKPWAWPNSWSITLNNCPLPWGR